MQSSALVKEINAPGGKVVIVGRDAHITLTDGRTFTSLFIDVPPYPGYALVGRSEILTDLVARLATSRAAALDGMSGVGKTALAIALAYDPSTLERFNGGILWAGLGPNPDAGSLLNRWATALETDVSREHDLLVRAHLLALALQKRTEGRPVLLVVDDAWTWEDARPFREIALPGCAYLLTTRDADVARKFAEPPSPVRNLTEEQALQLLAEKCPQAQQADPQGLAMLAGAVGGLPLGLTLIAAELNARAGQLRWVRAAMDRLRKAQAQLALKEVWPRPGMEGVPSTLRAIVEASVEPLEPEEQTAFTALAAFAAKPATFGRKAVLGVWMIPEDRSDEILQKLVDRSVLEIAGEDRFSVHPILSAVAAERLSEDAEPRQRHARYYLDFVNVDREAWQRIEPEMDQVRRAWAWISVEAPDADEQVLAYLSALRLFFDRRGLWRDNLAWHDRALTAARVLQQKNNEAATLSNIGAVYSGLGDKQQALQYYEQALPLQRAAGDRGGEAGTLNNIGLAHSDLGDMQEALKYYEQALPVWRAVGDRGSEATTLGNIGAVYSALGDKQQALQYYEQALPLQRAVGDRGGEARTFNNIGMVYGDLGDMQQALQYYEQALPLQRALGDSSGKAVTLFNMAMALDGQGLDSQAVSLLEQVAAIDKAIGHPDLENDTAMLERVRSKANVQPGTA
jgi:tetratricopeptide (TPR) repeat protein